MKVPKVLLVGALALQLAACGGGRQNAVLSPGPSSHQTARAASPTPTPSPSPIPSPSPTITRYRPKSPAYDIAANEIRCQHIQTLTVASKVVQSAVKCRLVEGSTYYPVRVFTFKSLNGQLAWEQSTEGGRLFLHGFSGDRWIIATDTIAGRNAIDAAMNGDY